MKLILPPPTRPTPPPRDWSRLGHVIATRAAAAAAAHLRHISPPTAPPTERSAATPEARS